MRLSQPLPDPLYNKGVAFLYSSEYQGVDEHEKYINEIMEEMKKVERHHSMIFRNAIIQYLEAIHTFPKPIVGGMDGDIAPPSFAANLAFDLRIATDDRNGRL